MHVLEHCIDTSLSFRSNRASRKAGNFAFCFNDAATTENAYEPVVIEGEAELVHHPAAIATFVARTNRKYRTEYSVEFFSSPSNACFQVRPAWAFGLTESDFTGSPTRWTFSPATS